MSKFCKFLYEFNRLITILVKNIGSRMGFYLHHFDIYKSIFKQDDQRVISAYLCESFSENEIIDEIKQKARSGLSTTFDYTNDLILKDKSLIDSISDSECFLIFRAASADYKNRCPLFYEDEWDSKLSIQDLCFLGWEIYNNRDSAMIDGIYPITMNKTKVMINNPKHINKWGLIPNMNICKEYLRRNQEDVCIFVNNEEQITNWEPVAVYCDKHTYQKLNNE